MKTFVKLNALILITLTMLYSCYDGIVIDGNNELTEETRVIPEFDQVYSSGSFNVIYSHADTFGIRIVCEANILPYIETAVFNHKLDIGFATHVSINLHQDIDVYVSSPDIEKIHLSGSGNIIADSLSGNNVEIMLSGSGNIYSNFYGQNLESTVSGSGKMEIFAACDTVITTVSGSGTIELETPDCLLAKVEISGSGKAELVGKAFSSDLKIIGSGKIQAFDLVVNNAEVIIAGSGNVYVNVTESLDAVISGSGNLYYIGNPRINFSGAGSGNLINDN